MYEAFSADYDRFVDWPARLSVEMPFLEAQLSLAAAKDVLDIACGTGMHAIELSSRGYTVSATDSSAAMVDVGRANAQRAGQQVAFYQAPLGGQAATVGQKFDAVLCLGNSLPHVLTPAELHAALADMSACLRPGGIAIVQSRNFDAVLDAHDRWMGPQGHDGGDTEHLFVRFYDFEPNGLLTFNVVTLRRAAGSHWQQKVSSTQLWPQRQADVEAGLDGAGFESWEWYGDMVGNRYEASSSPNLIVAARVGRPHATIQHKDWGAHVRT